MGEKDLFVRLLLVVVILVLAGAASAFASGGAGEMKGKVIDVRRQGNATVFHMEIESQEMYSKDPPLKSPARMIFAGERQQDIKSGQHLRVWFNGGNNDDPDSLNVTRIDFPDGTSVFHTDVRTQPVGMTQNVEARPGPPWWIEPMRMASGMFVFFIATVGLYRYVTNGREEMEG
jgi:hypothetical protein